MPPSKCALRPACRFAARRVIFAPSGSGHYEMRRDRLPLERWQTRNNFPNSRIIIGYPPYEDGVAFHFLGCDSLSTIAIYPTVLAGGLFWSHPPLHRLQKLFRERDPLFVFVQGIRDGAIQAELSTGTVDCSFTQAFYPKICRRP